MKYRIISPIVELIQYDESKSDLYVRRRLNGSAYVWNDKYKKEINIANGDYVNITTPGDFYVMDKIIVESQFERVIE